MQAALAQQVSDSSPDSKQLSELRSQIRQLIKFVALNYLAVVKAIKKRNRHCKVGRAQPTVCCIAAAPAPAAGCFITKIPVPCTYLMLHCTCTHI